MKRLFPWLLLATFAGGWLAPATAFAQAAAGTPNQAVFPQTANRGVLQFTSASSAGTYATLYTAGLKGSICKALWLDTSDSGATHLVTLQLVNGGTKYGGVAITSTLGAGFAGGVPPQSMMTSVIWPGLPIDQNGNPYLYLINGDTLQATFATAITASAQLDLHVVCSDF
jgi:hypothetical protein